MSLKWFSTLWQAIILQYFIVVIIFSSWKDGRRADNDWEIQHEKLMNIKSPSFLIIQDLSVQFLGLSMNRGKFVQAGPPWLRSVAALTPLSRNFAWEGCMDRPAM